MAVVTEALRSILLKIPYYLNQLGIESNIGVSHKQILSPDTNLMTFEKKNYSRF